MTPALIGLWIAIADRAVALWERITRKKPPTDPTATAPVTSAPDGTVFYRKRPSTSVVAKGGVIASLALLCITAAGCATFKASSLPELAKLCEIWVPCSACDPITPCPPVIPTPCPPLPEPDPDPGPPPVVDDPPVEGDAVPLGDVTWHDADPSGYPITATLDQVTVVGGTTGPVRVCWWWSRPSWPQTPDGKADGNMYVIAKINGKWEGGTWEMTSPRFGTQVCRNSEAKKDEPPMIQSHGLNDWIPVHGEKVCWVITTLTRNPQTIPVVGKRARTNAVCGLWP